MKVSLENRNTTNSRVCVRTRTLVRRIAVSNHRCEEFKGVQLSRRRNNIRILVLFVSYRGLRGSKMKNIFELGAEIQVVYQ